MHRLDKDCVADVTGDQGEGSAVPSSYESQRLERPGGWVSDKCLILFAPESPDATERARRLRPQLLERIDDAMTDVEEFHRRLATEMGLS
jgi:hypothetical protein